MRIPSSFCTLNACVAAILLAGCGGFDAFQSSAGHADVIERLDHPLASLGSESRAVRPNAYTWSQIHFAASPPYPIRTKTRYFTGTVPVVLEPFNRYSSFYGFLAALLNHTDKNGDYALYSYNVAFWTSLNEYFTSIQIDGATEADWAITDQGYMWSDYYGGTTGTWTKYFPNRTFSSLAVHAPAEYHPEGFLFATERSGTNKCYPSYEPCGHPVLQFNPSGKWPHGTWENTGWGGYQVAADPHYKNNEVVVLDDNHDVWEIIPVIRSSSFEGYLPIQLGTIKCSGTAITFEEVAAYDDVFLGLDDHKAGHAVWYYNSKRACWYEIGSKTGITSIATDPNAVSGSYSLVWAVDSHGNVWYAH